MPRPFSPLPPLRGEPGGKPLHSRRHDLEWDCRARCFPARYAHAHNRLRKEASQIMQGPDLPEQFDPKGMKSLPCDPLHGIS